MMIHTLRNLLIENKLRVSLNPKHPHPPHTQRPLHLPFAATATGGPSLPSSSNPSDLTSWDNTSWEEGTQDPSKPPSSWNSYDQSSSSSSGSSNKLPFVAAITGVALFSFLLGRQLTDYRRHHYKEELSKQPSPLESALADIPNDNNNNNDIDKGSLTAEDQGAIFADHDHDHDDDGGGGGDSSKDIKRLDHGGGGLHLEKEFKQAMVEEAQQQQPSSSSSKTAVGETELQPQQQQHERGDLDQGGVMQSEMHQDGDLPSATTIGDDGLMMSGDDAYSNSNGRLPLRSLEAELLLQKAQEKEIRRLHLYDRLEVKQEGGKAKMKEGEGEEIAASKDESRRHVMSFEALQKQAMLSLKAATKASVAAKRASESAALSTEAAAQSAKAAMTAMKASRAAAAALEIRSQEQVQAAYKEAKQAERRSEQQAQSAAVSAAHVLIRGQEAKSSSRAAVAAADMSEPGIVENIRFQWMKIKMMLQSVWNFICRNMMRLRRGWNGGDKSEAGEQVEAAVVDKNTAGKKGNNNNNEDEEVAIGTTKKRRRWLRVR